MPVPPAASLVVRFDFPRESADAVHAASETLAVALRASGVTPEIVAVRGTLHRADAAAVLWILSAAAWAATAGLSRRAARVRSAARRSLGVAAAVAMVAGAAALAGAFDPILPASELPVIEAVVAPVHAPARREVLLGAHLDSKTELFDHSGRAIAYASACACLALAAAITWRRRGTPGAALGCAMAALACAIGAVAAGGARLANARSHGIADDAAAVALLCELAAEARVAPLATTQLRFVWWCFEEHGAQGSAAWWRQRGRVLPDLPRAGLNLECLGAGPTLGFAAREWTGAGWRRAPELLVARLQAAAHDSLRALAVPVVTDAGPLRRAGMDIVTLVGLRAGGGAPRGMHRPGDRLAALDRHGLEEAGWVVRRFLAQWDAEP